MKFFKLPDLGPCFDWFGKTRIPPAFWVFVLWFLLIAPAIGIRGAHFEEGSTIGLARGAFEDGHWLTPYLYGERFAERPVLVSWLLGLVGLVIGHIPLWIARLPMVFSYLAGAELILFLVRRYASTRAAVFGAICFLFSPMMLQKTITAEVDGVVSVLLFAGFVTWWAGHARGGPSIMRWLAVAAIASAASLVKGPQPLGYFFLGIGSYLLIKRSWREFASLFCCGIIAGAVTLAWYWSVRQGGDMEVWVSHSRLVAPESAAAYMSEAFAFIATLFVEWLPGVLLAVPLAFELMRRRFGDSRSPALALLFYAGICTIILMFWPHARTRYAMPGLLALAAAAGLALDYFLDNWKKAVDVAQIAAAALITYALVLNWLVMPLAPNIFQMSRRHGDAMALAMAHKPGTLYVTPEAMCTSELVYIKSPVLTLTLDKIERLTPPFFAILTPDQEKLLESKKEFRLNRRFAFGGSPVSFCFNEIMRP